MSGGLDATPWWFITDGDTLRIGSGRIRFHGIDASESAQRCRAGGETWARGAVAPRTHRMRLAGRSSAPNAAAVPEVLDRLRPAGGHREGRAARGADRAFVPPSR